MSEKTQARLCAEMVVGQFWISQVNRVAQSLLAASEGRSILLVPPREEDYANAASVIGALLAPAETSLAVAGDGPEGA